MTSPVGSCLGSGFHVGSYDVLGFRLKPKLGLNPEFKVCASVGVGRVLGF